LSHAVINQRADFPYADREACPVIYIYTSIKTTSEFRNVTEVGVVGWAWWLHG